MILSAAEEFIFLLETEAEEDELPDVEEDVILSIVKEFEVVFILNAEMWTNSSISASRRRTSLCIEEELRSSSSSVFIDNTFFIHSFVRHTARYLLRG